MSVRSNTSASRATEAVATAASDAAGAAEGTGSSSSGPSAAAVVVAVAAAAADAIEIGATAAGDASKPDSTPWPSGQVFPIYFQKVERPLSSVRLDAVSKNRPGLAASRGPPVLESLRRLIDSLRLPRLEPPVIESAGVLFIDFDMQQVQLRFHEVAELRPFRLVLFVPHPGELLVLVVDHRRHRLNSR